MKQEKSRRTRLSRRDFVKRFAQRATNSATTALWAGRKCFCVCQPSPRLSGGPEYCSGRDTSAKPIIARPGWVKQRFRNSLPDFAVAALTDPCAECAASRNTVTRSTSPTCSPCLRTGAGRRRCVDVSPPVPTMLTASTHRTPARPRRRRAHPTRCRSRRRPARKWSRSRLDRRSRRARAACSNFRSMRNSAAG